MSETAVFTSSGQGASGSSGIVEGLAGLAVAILAILGLADTLPKTLASIATVVAGVALAALGAAVVASFSTMTSASGGGVGIEMLGGIVAVILGILALMDVAPWTLLSVAVVVIGASLLLGSRIGTETSAAAGAALLATNSAQALVGVAGIALGILALVNIQAEILVLVALLAFGGAVLLSSAAVTGRMLTLIRS
jgi:hypothetical protein